MDRRPVVPAASGDRRARVKPARERGPIARWTVSRTRCRAAHSKWPGRYRDLAVPTPPRRGGPPEPPRWARTAARPRLSRPRATRWQPRPRDRPVARLRRRGGGISSAQVGSRSTEYGSTSSIKFGGAPSRSRPRDAGWVCGSCQRQDEEVAHGGCHVDEAEPLRRRGNAARAQPCRPSRSSSQARPSIPSVHELPSRSTEKALRLSRA